MMLRSLQKSVRPALSSSWRAAQPSAPGASALGLGFSLPAPAHPTAHRNGSRNFHKSFTSANWRQDSGPAPVVSENTVAESNTTAENSAPTRTVDPAVTKYIGIWNVPKDTTEGEIKEYLVKACGIQGEFDIRMVLSERHSGWNVFLNLENIEAAQKALEAISKTPFKNMNLHASSSRGPKAPNGRTNTVVIGNIGRQTRPEELDEYLKKNFVGVKSARVAEIRIPAVFLQFENEDYAEVALDQLKQVDTLQVSPGQETHRIFATFANHSHGQPVVRQARQEDWETASQVSRAPSNASRYSGRTSSPQTQRVQESSSLWIGNLSEGYDQRQLKKILSSKPGFSSCFFPKPSSEKPARWARVEFADAATARAAKDDLHGLLMNGDSLNVRYAWKN